MWPFRRKRHEPDTTGPQRIIQEAEDAKRRMQIRSSYVSNVSGRLDARIDDNHFALALREAWARKEA